MCLQPTLHHPNELSRWVKSSRNLRIADQAVKEFEAAKRKGAKKSEESEEKPAAPNRATLSSTD